MSSESKPGNLFVNNAVSDLESLITEAEKLNARRLLLLAGKHPVCRVGTQLSPPLRTERLHFKQTQNLVQSILSPNQVVELDNAGEIDAEITIGSRSYSVNIFFGDGSHNVIIYLSD